MREGIVERLRRGIYLDESGFGSTEETMTVAADEIEWLRALNSELLAALKEIAAIRTAADWNGKTLGHCSDIALAAIAKTEGGK
jgi:hypothetical protein